MQEITDLINQWNKGDEKAFDKLVSVAYSRLHKSASRSLGFYFSATSLQATELVNELYLCFRGQKNIRFTSAEHFFAIATLKLRQILQSRHKKKSAKKRDSDRKEYLIDADSYPAEFSMHELLVVSGFLDFIDPIDPEKARIVELKVFWEFDNSEIAEILGVSESTLARKWRVAKASIAKRIYEEYHASA